MTCQRLLTTILVSLALSGFSILRVSAQLPTVEKQPWQGYYAAFSNKNFQFTVTSDGQIKITPIGDGGESVAQKMNIPIDITIQEVSPDGKITNKKVKLESLQSNEPATNKLVKAAFTGKVTGDASFEVVIEQQRNVIFIGGRMLDSGTLKNPPRFSIHVKFPDPYLNAVKTGKKEGKAFEKIIDRDRVDLKWADGKRKRAKLDENVEAIAKEGNGTGITSMEIDISSYKGKKFEFACSPNALMNFSNDQPAALHEGFTLVWTPDSNKDPSGKARLSFEVK